MRVRDDGLTLAGRSLLSPSELAPAGILAAYALTDIEPDPDRCMTEAGPLLERLAATVARDWLTGGPMGPEASVFIFPVIAILFWALHRKHREVRYPAG